MSRDRGTVELVRNRREHLSPEERALLEQVFLHGRPLVTIAALTGEPVRSVRRRVKLLLRRIARPEFDAVVMRSADWPREMAVVGAAVFVRGLSILRASRVTGVPYCRALLHARAISSLAASLTKRGRGEAA